MTFTDEQQRKLAVAQEILGYRFADEQLLLSAITHPSATEGKSVKYSYERLEFLGRQHSGRHRGHHRVRSVP